MSVTLSPGYGAVLKNPTENPVIMPEGPFIFSNHPGSGSDFVQPTIIISFLLYYLSNNFFAFLIQYDMLNISKLEFFSNRIDFNHQRIFNFFWGEHGELQTNLTVDGYDCVYKFVRVT